MPSLQRQASCHGTIARFTKKQCPAPGHCLRLSVNRKVCSLRVVGKQWDKSLKRVLSPKRSFVGQKAESTPAANRYSNTCIPEIYDDVWASHLWVRPRCHVKSRPHFTPNRGVNMSVESLQTNTGARGSPVGRRVLLRSEHRSKAGCPNR